MDFDTTLVKEAKAVECGSTTGEFGLAKKSVRVSIVYDGRTKIVTRSNGSETVFDYQAVSSDSFSRS